VTLTEAKRAVEAVRAEFATATINGIEYVHTASPGCIRTAPRAFLLPPFDEYTVAYADRDAVLDREQLVSAGHGIGANLIIDGRIAAQWRRTFKRDTVVELDPLRPLTTDEQDLVPAAVERYARFLGLNPTIARIG
jgi:hypothetical protein